jgi:hypothetical protein
MKRMMLLFCVSVLCVIQHQQMYGVGCLIEELYIAQALIALLNSNQHNANSLFHWTTADCIPTQGDV